MSDQVLLATSSAADSKYVTAVLTAAGVDCYAGSRANAPAAIPAVASWEEVPWLPTVEGPVVHVVRHPYLAAAEWQTEGALYSDTQLGAIRRQVVQGFAPGLMNLANLEAFVALWCVWHAHILRYSDYQMRIVDLQDDPVTPLSGIFENAGHPVDAVALAEAVASVPDPVPRGDVSWRALEDAVPRRLRATWNDLLRTFGYHQPLPHEYRGPAVSRWKRRRGAGPRGVRLADDFDAPLPEFDDYPGDAALWPPASSSQEK